MIDIANLFVIFIFFLAESKMETVTKKTAAPVTSINEASKQRQ